MKFTLSWLKEHLETDVDAMMIAERLTMLGLEIETVVDRTEDLAPFTVARVTEAIQHPNADRLRVCRVETVDGEVQVVCGAPNARSGMKGIFAAAGTYIPGIDTTLKKAAIRGVESNGMLLSERELRLSDEHEGIIDLPEDAVVGTSAAIAMGLDDVLFDIAITPNRGDCLGVRGIARDLAAAGIGTLKPLDTTPIPGAFDSPVWVHLNLPADKTSACPMFIGRYVRGVKNVESPRWLRDRLNAVGMRPISALVDITNLMALDLCRPLHVFDADKLKGDIHVRMGREGEKFLALNGREYELDAEMTVIAGDSEAEALGGVMGGERSGCKDETVNVMLESALFDPVRTTTTGRKLNLISDARYRFERGIDSAFLEDGAEIATRLILEICGGEASHLVVAGGTSPAAEPILLRDGRVASLGGVSVPKEEARRILDVLGFETSDANGGLLTRQPTWRNDISGEACLVEEVIRVHGFHNVPAVPLVRDSVMPAPALNASQRRRTLARRILADAGLVEAVTYSFMGADHAEHFTPTPDDLKLVNPISAELDVMRPSILPNLMLACGRNADRGIADACLFEIGPQFAGHLPEDQSMVAAGVRSGRAQSRHWAAPSRDVDAYDAKSDAVAVFSGLGLPVDNLQVVAEAPGWYHPGRSGVLRLDPRKPLAFFGELHPRVLVGLDVKGPMVGFEIMLENLPGRKVRAGSARPALDLSLFQPVERDFAFIVGEDITADRVTRAARGADRALITNVHVFDVFAGKSLGVGRKSIAINVTLQPRQATLTEVEIDAVADKVVAAVIKVTGGALRS